MFSCQGGDFTCHNDSSEDPSTRGKKKKTTNISRGELHGESHWSCYLVSDRCWALSCDLVFSPVVLKMAVQGSCSLWSSDRSFMWKQESIGAQNASTPRRLPLLQLYCAHPWHLYLGIALAAFVLLSSSVTFTFTCYLSLVFLSPVSSLSLAGS